MNKLYCYAPQRHAIAANFSMSDLMLSVVPVQKLDSLRGLTRPTFIYISLFSEFVPADWFVELRRQGAVIIKIDDQWAREHAARERS